MKKTKFTTRTISIETVNGRENVEAQVINGGPWATHFHVDRPLYWQITHIPTGLGLFKCVVNSRIALEIAKTLDAETRCIKGAKSKDAATFKAAFPWIKKWLDTCILRGRVVETTPFRREYGK